MEKVSNALLKVFAYGIVVCLFAGGFSLVGYLAGLIIGGEIATELCSWTYNAYLPWVIRITTVFTGIGLLGMYLSKRKTLTVEIDEE